jgi:hypothetical protein
VDKQIKKFAFDKIKFEPIFFRFFGSFEKGAPCWPKISGRAVRNSRVYPVE